MAKVIDVILRMKDQMSPQMAKVSKRLETQGRYYQRLGRQVQNTGRKISSVGSTLTKSITLPVAALGGASVKAAADFEKGMSDTMAIMGTTGKEAEDQRKKLEEYAKSLSNIGFSADEVTEAYKYMGMAGWKTDQILAGTAPILKLAAATGTELGRTSDIVTDALTAFGASAEQAADLADILAKASTSSNTNVEMLGETFKYAAPVAGAFGYSMSETAAMAGLMANAGIKASQAGTTLRSTMSNLLAPTKAAQAQLEKYGLNAEALSKMSLKEQMETLRNTMSGLSKTEQAMFAKSVAGKNAMSGFLAIMKTTDDQFKAFTDTIDGSSGALDQMYSTSMDNLTGQWKILKADLKDVGIEIGTILMPYAKKGVEYIKKAVSWFRNLDEEQKKHILKLAGIAAAAGPVLTLVGKFTSGIGGLIGSMGGLMRATSNVGGVLGLLGKAFPIGVLLGGVGLFSGAWSKVSEAIHGTWDTTKSTTENISNAFNKLFTSVDEGGLGLGEDLKNVFEGVGKAVMGVCDTVFPAINKLGDGLNDVIVKVGRNVSGLSGQVVSDGQNIENFWTGVKGFFDTLLDGVVNAAIHIGEFLGSIFTGIADFVGGIVKSLGGLLDFITGIFTLDFEKALTGIKDFFGGIADAIIGIIRGLVNAIIAVVNFLKDVINAVTGWIPYIFTGGETYNWIPDIPYWEKSVEGKAVGDNNWKGGLVNVHERGGELIDLPRGSRIYPHDESVKMAYQDGMKTAGGMVVNIPKLADQIVVREDTDIDLIATKLAHKLEKTSQNLGASKMGYQYQS